MSIKSLKDGVQLRGGTASNLAIVNPVPKAREIMIETDTMRFKIGDGVTSWNELAYCSTTQAGDSGVTNSAVNSRLETLENAISQVLLALEEVNQYPDYMNFIVENFNNTNQIDTFTTNITSITQGSNTISVEDVTGMLPQSWYVISDGINSERVQVSCINIINGVNNVILTTSVTNSYITGKAELYRSSVLINNGLATNSGIIHGKKWLANIDWSGFTEHEEFNVESEINASNYELFTFDGAVNFTSEGYFCIAEVETDSGETEEMPTISF